MTNEALNINMNETGKVDSDSIRSKPVNDSNLRSKFLSEYIDSLKDSEFTKIYDESINNTD